MDYGAVMTSAQFLDVGSKNGVISLDSIVPIGADGVDTSYSVDIQLLDNGGFTIEESDYMWDGTQWLQVTTFAPPESPVTFQAGQGLWVFNTTGAKIQFRSVGEVNQQDVDFALDLDFGAVGVGNPYPTSISLNSIVPVVDGETDLSYGIDIQILDNGGFTIEDSDYIWDGTQWLQVSTFAPPETDVVFSAGQGLWVFNTSGAAAKLRLPAPEL